MITYIIFEHGLYDLIGCKYSKNTYEIGKKKWKKGVKMKTIRGLNNYQGDYAQA